MTWNGSKEGCSCYEIYFGVSNLRSGLITSGYCNASEIIAGCKDVNKSKPLSINIFKGKKILVKRASIN
jgi:hypothetical protein